MNTICLRRFVSGILVGITVVFGAVFPARAEACGPPRVASPRVLDGSWTVHSASLGPIDVTGLMFGTAVEFRSPVCSVQGESPKRYSLTQRVDGNWFDHTNKAGNRYRGLYSLQGDTLTLVYPGNEEAERPTRVPDGPREGLIVVTLKRKR